VLAGQTVVKAVTVVVTQVSLEKWAETAAPRVATTASLENCILIDLDGNKKIYLKK